LWCCGVVVLWCCGVVVLWCCGVVVLWCCGVVVLWRHLTPHARKWLTSTLVVRVQMDLAA